MALSDMEVFNKYYMPVIFETLDQMTEKFNAASNGAIRMTSEGFEGDFMHSSFYARLAGARRRVDRYGANSDVAAVDLRQDKHTSVKVAGGYGPARFEPAQLGWLRKPTTEAIEVMSRMFAQDLLQDQLNTAVAALVAAISNQGALTTVDVSTTKRIDHIAINESHSLFGDQSASIVAQIMDGVQYHNFIGQNLANTNTLFQAGNVRVVDILGRVSVVTDAPALFTPAVDETPAKRRVLSLVSGAATIHDDRNMVTNISTTNGKQRIETTLQIDYDFGVGLNGYAWDEGNGGKSPSDIALASGANWDKVAESIKHTAGVLTIGQA